MVLFLLPLLTVTIIYIVIVIMDINSVYFNISWFRPASPN